jgi:hypothetical protein
MHLKYKIIFGLTFMLSTAFAQKTIHGQAVWVAYTGQYKFTKKFSTHLEVQWRGDANFEQNKQNLFRFGGIYHLNKKTTLSAGYGLIKTFKPSLNDFFTENRAWEQIQYNHNWNENKNTMSHRFRLEQRFVDNIVLNSDDDVVVEATNYQNRLRYLNRNLFHLFNFNNNRNKAYAILQDELFFNLGDNKLNANFFDQNRFLAGFGINYENTIRLEIGYLNHLITPSKGNDIMNHNISMSITHNLDYTNSKK